MDNFTFTLEELRERIGNAAEQEIVNHYGLTMGSDGKYNCMMTDHNKGGAARMTWLSGFKFRCCDCQQLYDIVDHATKCHIDSPKGYLEALAGVRDDILIKPIKPVNLPAKQKPIKRYNKDFSGLKDLDKPAPGLSDNAIKYLDSRRITKQAADAFGLLGDDDNIYLTYWARQTNEPPKPDAFTLCKIKGRKLGNLSNKAGDKYLRIPGGEGILFGAHMYLGQKRLIITEGEFDCIAMYLGIRYVNSLKDIMTVSVPNGSGATGWIDECEAFLRQFEVIIICPDADGDGIKMRENCFEKLITKGFDVRWINLRRKLKNKSQTDINELLINCGLGPVSDLLKIIETPYHAAGLIANKIKDPEKEPELFYTGFTGLDRSCKFEFGETTILAGESNDGKTTVCRQWIHFAIKCGWKIGAFFGEETNITFRNLGIRQSYDDPDNFKDVKDFWGDFEPKPTNVAKNRWSQEFGKHINLFQLGRVRDGHNLADELLDWIRHCADVEGRKVFFVDNLMKITAGDPAAEMIAQARFIEQLYNLAQQKMIHIVLVVHTKKIEGIINGNSISGTKKIYNTPDYVLFFQRLERIKLTGSKTHEDYANLIRTEAKISSDIEFTSFIRSHKIRNRPAGYHIDMHVFRYNSQTTCSTELLPVEYHKKTHEHGNSEILSPRGVFIPEIHVK